MSDLNAKLGARVRALRKARGMTQAALAEAAGVSQTTLSRLEKGHQCPSIEGIERIGAAMGVSLAMMVDFDGEIASGGDPVEQLMQLAAANPDEMTTRMRGALRLLFGTPPADAAD